MNMASMLFTTLTCVVILRPACASPFYPYEYPNNTDTTNASPTNPSPISLPLTSPTTNSNPSDANSPPPPPPAQSAHSPLSDPGTIVGISLVGALAVVLVVSLILWACMRRRTRLRRQVAEMDDVREDDVGKAVSSPNRVLEEKETEQWFRRPSRSALPPHLWRARVGPWPY
ncbi:hypothetical protein K491DRAFT_117599 [Lophiostoma macrostomum CBS 122681]|uniref:Mid2 domain-containing protein n=1 Tax=Lophiostoma macrostomum CBS 122681 TaxID=1314788 RepID=A0A6A6SX64_9PLEO|nr:hypothetical protein K491DRAFT_117599 [Lophiostoma macrostomum CBS 122681]